MPQTNQALVRHIGQFDGHKLTTLDLDGRTAWIAREVGEAIGYAQRGKRFTSQITGAWSDELLSGHDYRVLTGSEVKAFKAGIFKGTGSVPLGGNRGLVVLFESGLHLALVKTQKAAGKRLRRFLAEKVLPQLVRTGRFEAHVPKAQAVGELREGRLRGKLDLEARRVALLERSARAEAVREAARSLHSLAQIDDETLAAYEVYAAELASGLDLTRLKPSAPASWLTPTEIGQRLGLNAYRIGRLITELGLRGDPNLSRFYLNDVGSSSGPVRCYAYAPEAVRRIEAALGAAA